MKIFATVVVALLAGTVLLGQTSAPVLKNGSGYHLQSSDSIEVLYRYTPEYNQTVTVQPDGSISLQLIGNVKVGGLTTAAAAQEIARQAGKRLLDPDVSVALKDFEKPHFTVLGEVSNPGRFELHGEISAVDAMAMAGGFKPTAKHTQIVLIHRLNGDMGEAQLLDFKKLERLHRNYEYPTLRDGDLLIVPQNKLSKVERLVRLTNVGVYYPL